MLYSIETLNGSRIIAIISWCDSLGIALMEDRIVIATKVEKSM